VKRHLGEDVSVSVASGLLITGRLDAVRWRTITVTVENPDSSHTWTIKRKDITAWTPGLTAVKDHDH
jgi:hypothetical protein